MARDHGLGQANLSRGRQRIANDYLGFFEIADFNAGHRQSSGLDVSFSMTSRTDTLLSTASLPVMVGMTTCRRRSTQTGLTGEVSECEAEEAICTARPRTSAGRSTLDVHEGRLCRPPVGQPR
jgi:hypothetical protein